MRMNIDTLQSQAISDPYYHGLGSVRVKINHEETINFYSKKHIPSISKYIHTHQTELHCEGLYGSYENILYDWKISEEESDWCMEEIQCKEGTHPELIHENVIPIIKSSEIFTDKIVHSYTGLHDLRLITDNVITKMRYNFNKYNPKATIIRKKSDKYICGLSQRGNPQENWEIIREVLNEI